MEFLESQENIEVTTFSDLMDRFSYQRDFVNKKDLQEIAAEIVSDQTIVIDEYFFSCGSIYCIGTISC